jgi:outer membrane protein assembly factor BamA
VLPLIALALPFRLSAQAPAATSAAPTGDDTLRAVVLDRRDIFDPDEQGWIARVANALHVQTRASTVRRELLFRAGQPYDSARIAESERNLRALGVFRRVRIDTVRTDSGLVARVLTKDGWSTKADWRFRSAGGEVAFTIGLVEDNLLGTASSAAVRYRKNPDRTSVTLALRRPRLFAGTVGLGLTYEDRSDGRVSGLALERPFYSLTSSSGFRFDAEDRDERVLRFFDGANVARDTLTHRYSLVRASGARALRASSEGYLRLGLQGQVRREDFLPEGSTAPFEKTITAAVGPYLAWSRAHFVVTTGYRASRGKRMWTSG